MLLTVIILTICYLILHVYHKILINQINIREKIIISNATLGNLDEISEHLENYPKEGDAIKLIKKQTKNHWLIEYIYTKRDHPSKELTIPKAERLIIPKGLFKELFALYKKEISEKRIIKKHLSNMEFGEKITPIPRRLFIDGSCWVGVLNENIKDGNKRKINYKDSYIVDPAGTIQKAGKLFGKTIYKYTSPFPNPGGTQAPSGIMFFGNDLWKK